MFNIEPLLTSAGWFKSENGKYKLNLSAIRFTFLSNEKGESVIQKREKFQNSRMWKPNREVKSGDNLEVAEYLSNFDLIEKRKYREEKEKYLKEKEIEEKGIKGIAQEKRRENINKKVKEIFNFSIKGVKQVAISGFVVSVVYVGYQSVYKQIDIKNVYLEVVNNMNTIDKMVEKNRYTGLTYKEIVNLDYAIENNKIERTLESNMAKNSINYREALESNQ